MWDEFIKRVKDKLNPMWNIYCRRPNSPLMLPTTTSLISSSSLNSRPQLSNDQESPPQSHNHDDDGTSSTPAATVDIDDADQMTTSLNLSGSTTSAPTVVDAETMMMICMQWPLMVFSVSFAVIGAALQALQIKGPLPLSTQLICMALAIFLTSVILSIYIRPYYKRTSFVILQFGVLIASTALMSVLVINLQPPLLEITVAIYLIAFLIIILCILLNSSPTTKP